MSTQRGTTTETAIATRHTETRELATSAAETAARAEVEGRMILARRFPRIEEEAYQQILHTVARPSMAEKASYRYKRGNSNIEGPSVYLAKEIARAWGNIQYGFEVVTDDGETRHLRGFAWDLQTNAKVTAEVSFRKLVQRKQGTGPNAQTVWVEPDERDLRELTNKHGAVLVRNCILDLIPRDFVEDALAAARKTRENAAATDPEGQRKAVLAAFATLNIPASELEQYLGCRLSLATPKQIADLRAIYTSIRDGHSRWDEYYPPKRDEGDESEADQDTAPPSTTAAALKPQGKRKQTRTRPPADPPATERAAEADGPLGEVLAAIAAANTEDEVRAAIDPNGDLWPLLTGSEHAKALDAATARIDRIRAAKEGRLV